MTVAFVQEWQFSDPTFGTSGTTVACPAATGNLTVGSAIHVILTCGSNTRPTTVADPANGNYNFIAELFDSGTSSYISHYYVNAQTSAAKPIITATWGSAQVVKAIAAREITGQFVPGNPIGSAFGGQVQQTPGTGANGVTTGAFATASLPGLISAAAIDFTGNGNIAAGTVPAFVAGFSTWTFGAGQPLLRTESLRVTTGATQVATFTQATNGPTGTLAALFVEAGAITAPFTPFTQNQFFVNDVQQQQ